MTKLKKIHKKFIWNNKRAKIKHSTLISDYSDGGLRDVDIESKVNSLHLSWLKRYFDSNFHPWKSIPKILFAKISPTDSLFFSNLFLENSCFLEKIPSFYQNMLKLWTVLSSSTPLTASSIMSQCIWYNSVLKIDNKIINPSLFKGFNKSLFIADFFDHTGKLLCWNAFKENQNIDAHNFYQWLQITNALPQQWKKTYQR